MERTDGRAAALQDRIVMDPNILTGKPVVRGTRIPVEGVLEQLAYNPDLDELFAIYPRLTRDDLRACLAYARAAVAARRRRKTGDHALAISHV